MDEELHINIGLLGFLLLNDIIFLLDDEGILAFDWLNDFLGVFITFKPKLDASSI